jgi:hypothetical protein
LTHDVRVDPSLGAAVLPRPPASLGATEAPVVRAAAAGSTSFLLEGERVAVVGSERRGARSFLIDGRVVASDLVTDAGAPANVVVGPATLRRELQGTRTSVIEHLLAVPALPLVAAQWSTPPGARPMSGLALQLTLLPGTRALRYRTDGGGLRASQDGGDTVVDVVVHPAPSEWAVGEADDGGIRARALVEADGPVTLLIAAGPAAQVERALGAAPHLASHEIRAAAAADPTKMDTLVVRSGVGELDDGVVWATSRVRAALRRTGIADADAVFWSGVGALGVGDVESAERALTLLGRLEQPGPLGVLLAARYALASGDQGPALSHLDALDPRALDGLRLGGRETWRGWPAALRSLADALHQSAPPSELDGLRALAARTPTAAGGGMRLPMAGDAPTAPSWWPAYLLGAGEGGPEPPAGPAPRGSAPWTTMGAGRVEAGYAAWRRTVSEGLAGGPSGRGTWDPAPVPWSAGAPGAAVLLATLAHGLLGIAPDAPSGRLRLAPALPGHIRSFAVDNIRVAEARVRLEYQREGRVHRYRLEPLGGRIPVMAVFEPSLPLESVSSIRVDGAEADLERSAEPGRVRLRVQLPLDATRTLEVEGS